MTHYNGTDETLVLLTLAGDQSAYETLVRKYEKIVIASAASVTRNSFMAEDAAQDAFVTAWMKLNTLREPDKYGAWVCRIAKNCARNIVARYNGFLSYEAIENIDISDDGRDNPAELYVLSEEKEQLHKSIGTLPDKIKQVIHLHYFEGLSIVDIAERMRVPEGTVKWQLHDGRKRIRKELCAMNEKWNDTLVEKVMKKVEELKLWQVRNDKSGFEAEYKEVLREVEELPESSNKHHALADVLMRGWWWLPGNKNDALFERIRQSAELGKNEEVMEFIVSREDSKVYGGARIDFMREKQIPRLEKAGFVKTLAREWFWLGRAYFEKGKSEEGHAAFDKVEELLQKDDVYRILVPYARAMEKEISTQYKDVARECYTIIGTAEEYRKINGSIRYWAEKTFERGWLRSVDLQASQIFRNASMCDGNFFTDIPLSETYVGTDGTKLTYISDNELVETPAGRFEGCQLWETRHWTYFGKFVCRTYYKEGIGIVRQEHTTDGVTDVRVLSSFNIKGGSGLIPLYPNNTWEYIAEHSPDSISLELKISVAYADDERVILVNWNNCERLQYNENSWSDMIQHIANDYCQEKNGRERICDVYPAIERAEMLASTPMEKAHTKAAASVARRILSTDTTFNPDYTATGHWNFFGRVYVQKKHDSLYQTAYNPRWSFEWKATGGMKPAEDPILFNDVYGILQDATNCLWSDEWRVGASPIVEYTQWNRTVKTQVTCEDRGTITTKAGTFENCLKLCLDIGGMEDGWSYRGGKKIYYFAEGIGIVRTENEYCGGARVAVYELTDYEGIGAGYMPMEDGMMRRYDALDLTDGFVASAVYTYVADDDGDIVVFSDRTGIREVQSPITQYSAIQAEVIEDRLWDEGKHKESRLCHDVNNFHLLCHFFGRPSRYWAAPEKAVAWNKYRIKVMESLGENGQVPEAWLGHYASTSFRTACALFGFGKKEEGYQWLEKTFEAYPKWEVIPEGAELEVGDPLIYGGVKLIKGKYLIKLPDGTISPIINEHIFDTNCNLIYYGMTAPRGWEWFNSVRNEERFKEYIERAKLLKEKYKK